MSKLSSELYIQHNRPFRLAIDISIWLFQIQSGKGGTNPALRTFYYRLLRLLCLNIHPLFVFDGPNKPLFKRRKRVGGPGVKVSSIPEFLAKQLLKHFGFPMHHAPGEAEAECALLQREGIVDAVLSEDVDTLMFGSGLTLRKWTSEGKKVKTTPTHVSVYDLTKTKESSGLDREGMILVAMMSGGDYIPEGIPGCGPKLACEAARAGFGTQLCALKKKDKEGIRLWKERLCHEIRTNESKFFKMKRKALTMPDDFPRTDILHYYTNPVISAPDKLQNLRDTLKWDMPIDYPGLRDFAKDAFDWRCLGGAKKFVRNLAPAMLIRELRLRGEAMDTYSDDLVLQQERETELVAGVHGKRNHASTDGELELRISFVPIKLVGIDLSIEDPDEELLDDDDEDSDTEPPPSQAPSDDEAECPPSPKKKRAPSNYDPTLPEKEWIIGTFVRLGAPLTVQDYETRLNAPKKSTSRNAPKTAKRGQKATEINGGMKKGALDRFAVSSKLRIDREPAKKSVAVDEIDLSEINEPAQAKLVPTTKARKTATKQPGIGTFGRVTKPGINRTDGQKSKNIDGLDLSAVNTLAKERQPSAILGNSFAVQMSQRSTVVEELDLTKVIHGGPRVPARRAVKRRSPEPASPYSRVQTASPPRKVMKQPEIIDLLSSSPARGLSVKGVITPPRQPELRRTFVRDNTSPQPQVSDVPLPGTVTRRRRKAPLRRHRTAPTAGEDMNEDDPTLRPMTPVPHDTVEAMDLASPLPQVSRPPDSPHSLPSPSMFGADRPGVEKPKAMTAAEIRPARKAERPPDTIKEWLRRSQSITPKKARFVDRLARDNVAVPAVISENHDVVSLVESSMPTPPTDEPAFDEADMTRCREAMAIEDLAVEQPQVSVGALLPSARYLRDRPGPEMKEHIALSAMKTNKSYSANTPYVTAESVPSDSKTAKGKSYKDRSKKRFIQPRESLAGGWKYVEEVDPSGQDQSYRKTFRISEVDMLDLTGD